MNFIKFFLVLFYFFICTQAHANTYSEINYSITPYLGARDSYVKVDIELKGEFFGNVVLNLPYNWMGVDYADQIKNIKLDESVNAILHFNEKQAYEVTIIVPHARNLKFSYDVQQKEGKPSNIKENIIKQDLIHSLGYGIFATPNDLKKDQKINFNITWQSIPLNWKILSNDFNSNIQSLKTTVSELLHSVYVVGDIRLQKLNLYKNPVYVSLYGSFDLTDVEIIKSLEEIINTQRNFFNDQNFSNYNISIFENNTNNLMEGLNLNDEFIAFLPRGFDKIKYYLLFAHEHFHSWFNGKINNFQNDELNFWWSEGFTEYYARVLALRSGGITNEEFICECNKFLKDYYLSPVIYASNRQIADNFWKDYNFEKLPYYRGFVFAVYLNHLIKEHNPDNSLDNVMFDLFKECKNKSFSKAIFFNILKKYTSQITENEFNKYIELGNIIDLNDLKFKLPILKEEIKNNYDKKIIYQFKKTLDPKESSKIKNFFS